jgi:endonuclease YncB( thermonuclease family)
VDSPLQLELDRRRHSDQGDLLAYAFLPNGRMLNAELIRLGLALPRSDSANVRYLAAEEEVGPCVGRPTSATPQFGSPRPAHP